MSVNIKNLLDYDGIKLIRCQNNDKSYIIKMTHYHSRVLAKFLLGFPEKKFNRSEKNTLLEIRRWFSELHIETEYQRTEYNNEKKN